MKIKILASGSKGNCTYIECGNIKFLIDVGISFMQLKRQLNDISVDVDDLNFVLLTHTHSDHIKGLKTLLSKTKTKMYIADDLSNELKNKISFNSVHIIYECFENNGIEIKLFPLSHDVPCYGFCIEYEKSKLIYITDTGYLNRRYLEIISNADVYILESNHDERVLMNNR